MTKEEKISWLTNLYQKQGYAIDEINLIGIRNSKDIELDVINDYLGYWTNDAIVLSPGTTEPSVYWTKDKTARSSSGTFHLSTGFHKSIWCVGIHRGYEALVNDYRYCKPTKGWRDVNYDFVENAKDVEVCDYFGINFHRMSENIVVKLIGRFSAGCQVFQNHVDFDNCLYTIKTSAMYKNVATKTVFNYLLIDIKDLPAGFLV